MDLTRRLCDDPRNLQNRVLPDNAFAERQRFSSASRHLHRRSSSSTMSSDAAALLR